MLLHIGDYQRCMIGPTFLTAINVGFWLFCGLFFLSQVLKVVHLLHFVFSTAIVFVVHSGDLHSVILILGNDLDL